MRTIVIGTGRMGQRHIEVCKNLDMNVVGIYDLNEANMKKAETLLGASVAQYTKVGDLFETTKPELAIIATTAPSHFDYIMQSVEAGVRFILCEKPICISLKQLKMLINLLEKNPNLKIAVNHQMRYMEQYTKIKALLTSENFGGLSSIAVQSGNFGLAMNGIHYLEMFRYLTDESPHSVWGWLKPQTARNPRGAQFIDQTGSIKVITASGKSFYLNASESQGHGVFVTYTAQFGQIVVDELSGKVYLSHRGSQDRDQPSTRYGMPATIENFNITPADSLEPTASVLSALLKEVDYPTVKEAGHAMEALIAAYVSSENNHAVVNINSRDLPLEREFPWA